MYCELCDGDINAVSGCSDPKMIRFDDGEEHGAVPHGAEKNPGRQRVICPECAVSEGNYHHPDCPNEECPRCRRRLVKCDCPKPVEHHTFKPLE